MRQWCLRFHLSALRKVINAGVILAFAFMSCFIDYSTMSSRQSTWVQIDRRTFVAYLYSMHAWFMADCLAGFVAFGIIHGRGSFLFDYLNAQDFLLAFIGLVSVDFVPALNLLRLFRVLHFLSLIPSMEFLREIIQLIADSLALLVSSIGIMLICSLFLAMFINNLIVVDCN